ncbi:DUF7344 domain-containing protein [Halococcus thailandensis]|uniref:DUF7344 domain-containing protein n=1 Tax=Halococcus thailandensis JCM 13552 TaxID=1227457 RepID=M0N381_9EURY|nr:hypothetical protein [Halococcus thailandensis]EMA52407.1 hypothetical protein C451_11863 [Halococcus thailandensis JCM 13552]
MSDNSSPAERTAADAIDPSVPSTGDARKQHLMGCLGRFFYPVELVTLATHVVASERTTALESVSDDERTRVAIRLHHIHIPELVERDLVEYDPESRMAIAASDSTAAPERSRWSNVP